MNDRRSITVTLAAFIAALAVVLVIAAVPSYAGTWLQQYGKSGACAEGWGESWAFWVNDGQGGAVCSRNVDDPSQPVAHRTPPGPRPVPTGWTLAGSGTMVGSSYAPNLTFPICTWSNARLTANTGVGVAIDYLNVAGQKVTLHNARVIPQDWELEVYCGQPPAPSWVVLHTPTLQPGEVVGGSIVGWCPNGSDPQGLRAVPNTDIAVLYYAQLMEGYLENLSGSTAHTFDLEALCSS